MATKQAAEWLIRVFLAAVALLAFIVLLIYVALPQLYLYSENKNFEALRKKSALDCDTMPLHCLVRDNRRDEIDRYVESGQSLDQTDRWGRSALHYAVFWQKPDAVASLLAAATPPDGVDEAGVSILYNALSSGQFGIADSLLASGADINGISDSLKQETALHHCVMTNNVNRVAWLMQNGAATDIEDTYGYSVQERIRSHTHIEAAIVSQFDTAN